MLRTIGRIALTIIGLLAVLVLIGLGVLYWQGTRKPEGQPEYVALGSSYAAGPGLGKRAPGSPFACMRTLSNYPHQLAALRHLSLVDMTCSGATAVHVLRGGQFFQEPQIAPIDSTTALVTLTAGGNDLDLVGGLLKMSLRDRASFSGRLMRAITPEPAPAAPAAFATLGRTLNEALTAIRNRAPHARIVVLTYPQILPPEGSCTRLGITAGQAAAMRPVEIRLAQITRDAAHRAGAELLDLYALSAGHDVCSAEPWISGAILSSGTAMHPNPAGTAATTQALDGLLSSPPHS